jgi:signal transduction histidine kinase
MDFGSIRTKVILLFIPLIIMPLLVGGIIGASYFQNVIKQNIWDDNMGQAKAVSALTSSYVNLSVNYLESIADRPLVISAMEDGNQSFLNETTLYTAVQSLEFDTVFITNDSGVVMSYNTEYTNITYPDIIGENYYERPYVGQVIDTSRPYVVAMRNDINGSSSVYVGVPIRALNNSTIGVIVGTFDMGNYTSMVIGTAVKSSHYIYLVNGSGNIIVHSNESYMKNMTDFSSVPAVQDVIQGRSGVIEQYNPIEKENTLASYYPVNGTGWGVIVAVPTSVAYQPVTDMLWVIGAVTIALAVISLALAYAFSKSITDPILGLYEAARSITNHREYRQYLPLKRKDEIGQVAVCIDNMARHIDEDRDKIIAERNKAEDENKRAELYLDVMGHDINNLNQTALGNLELILEESNLSEDEKEYIERSLIAIRSSAGIIENVRSLQQLSGENVGLERLDLNDAILESIKEAPRPADKKITINYTPRKGIMVKCVPLLKEIFSNLINNSIKYSGPEVTVDIEIGEKISWDKKYYTVTVSDNGIGIPDEVKSRLFNRFQRGTTNAHGKGLGLYIVKSILEKCDGSVEVEDRVHGDPSKGAKFTVMIPAVEL